jgi:Bacteriodetes cell division protein (FtsL-like)
MQKINIPDWKLILNKVGQKGIVSNIPLILYVSFLALVYITINHHAENTIRDINRTAKELKELRWRYVDEKTQIMSLTKESNLQQSASVLGLKKTLVPPYKIAIEIQEQQ